MASTFTEETPNESDLYLLFTWSTGPATRVVLALGLTQVDRVTLAITAVRLAIVALASEPENAELLQIQSCDTVLALPAPDTKEKDLAGILQ